MTRGIIPLVRLDCENSRKLARALNSPVIFIPIYDLISDTNAEPNELFQKIKSQGGIHNFFNYKGIVVLSLIMRDDLIWKSLPKKYAKIINGIKPDAYTTVDGATYNKEELKSFNELIRLSDETRELLKLCPNIKPIGHIKGCNSEQIKLHFEYFKQLGINVFIFHVGDFFRNGDESMIQQAKHFCSLIKQEDNMLFLYGLGSPKRMVEFSFADFFVTYGHFVNARNGKIFAGTRKINYSNMSVYEAAVYNFKELSNHLKKLKYQTKLFTGGKCAWVAGQQEPQFIIQSLKVKT